MAQPNSSTRQFSTAAGRMPISVATVAMQSGCVGYSGLLPYGTSS